MSIRRALRLVSWSNCGRMKVVRVPWIRCRADEVGACAVDLHWRKQNFSLIANSEREAQDWWGGLGEEERDAALGLDEPPQAEQASFW